MTVDSVAPALAWRSRINRVSGTKTWQFIGVGSLVSTLKPPALLRAMTMNCRTMTSTGVTQRDRSAAGGLGVEIRPLHLISRHIVPKSTPAERRNLRQDRRTMLLVARFGTAVRCVAFARQT